MKGALGQAKELRAHANSLLTVVFAHASRPLRKGTRVTTNAKVFLGKDAAERTGFLLPVTVARITMDARQQGATCVWQLLSDWRSRKSSNN